MAGRWHLLPAVLPAERTVDSGWTWQFWLFFKISGKSTLGSRWGFAAGFSFVLPWGKSGVLGAESGFVVQQRTGGVWWIINFGITYEVVVGFEGSEWCR
jgi:hypothetical protein